MTTDRIKEIRKKTAYPNSKSVQQALLQVWNECQEDIADKWFEYPKNIPPIHSENYLIVDNGYIQISLFRGDYNKFQHELVGAEKCNITHWMPLPNKPLNKQD